MEAISSNALSRLTEFDFGALTALSWGSAMVHHPSREGYFSALAAHVKTLARRLPLATIVGLSGAVSRARAQTRVLRVLAAATSQRLEQCSSSLLIKLAGFHSNYELWLRQSRSKQFVGKEGGPEGLVKGAYEVAEGRSRGTERGWSKV
eukprot:2973871-Pleurochrysis_carterae.AAC.2